MTKAEYRKALARLELTIVGAAPVLGISRRQAQRLAADEGSAIPEPVAKLLRVMIRHGIAPDQVAEL